MAEADGGDDRTPALGDTGADLWETLVAYARQETVDPIKGVGRYIGFGAGGSLMMAVGVGLGVLALLRALQTETGSTFTGSWSWAPYMIALVATLIIIGIAAAAIRGRADDTDRPGRTQ